MEHEYQDRKPSQFILWVIGIYFALYGVAFQRYELSINRLNNTYNSYIELLGNNPNNEILQEIINLQIDSVPLEGVINKPWSIVRSFTQKAPFDDIAENVGLILPNYINCKTEQIRNFKALSDIDIANCGNMTIDYRKCVLGQLWYSKIDSIELTLIDTKSEYIFVDKVKFIYFSTRSSSVDLLSYSNSTVRHEGVANHIAISESYFTGDVDNPTMAVEDAVIFDAVIETDTITTLGTITKVYDSEVTVKEIVNFEGEIEFYNCIVNGDSVNFGNKIADKRVLHYRKRYEMNHLIFD